MAKTHHYVYYSYEEWGRGYIGKRSCACSPEEDVLYFGSFKDRTFKPTKKEIICTFSTEKEAIEAEIILHNFYKIDINPHFANKAKQSSSSFSYKATGKSNNKYRSRDWIHAGFGRQTDLSVTDLIKKFPEQKLSQAHLSGVALGNRSEHKGWRLLFSKRKTRGAQRHWIHPNHGVFLNVSNRKLCSITSTEEKKYYHNMLSKVIKGALEHHKGWMLYHTVLTEEQLLNT